MKWADSCIQGRQIVLKNFEDCEFNFPTYANPRWIQENQAHVRQGMTLDVETTGLNSKSDKIIEIGLRPFLFHRETGEVLHVGKPYSAFEDPMEPLAEEIVKLTGITDEMLKGQEIDWSFVESIFEKSQIIIAHNAAFDRSFLDLKVSISQDKVWSCSLKQIDWKAKGFSIHKLEILSIFHGFFIGQAHRALHDADALLYLLSLKDVENKSTYLNELLINARRPSVCIRALHAPFESKDKLKKKYYSWNASQKFWFRNIFKDDLDQEIEWIEKDVYKGPFVGEVQEIKIIDNFKSFAVAD